LLNLFLLLVHTGITVDAVAGNLIQMIKNDGDIIIIVHLKDIMH